jgi:hypothetical protein
VKTVAEIKKLLTEHKQELRKEFKVKEIALFGSYIREGATEGSDLDILVSFSEPVSLLDLVRVENFLTSLIGIKVDVVPKEDIRPELKKIILEQAVYV